MGLRFLFFVEKPYRPGAAVRPGQTAGQKKLDHTTDDLWLRVQGLRFMFKVYI